MKFTSYQFFALALIAAPVLAAVIPETRSEQTCEDPARTVALLRGYQPGTHGDHFYTTSALEMENTVGNLHYNSEGDTGYVFPYQAVTTVPLFRTYSPHSNDHFYTASFDEKNNAISHLGYVDEGVTGFIYQNGTECGVVPLFRAYSPSQLDHFYTTSKDEKDYATSHYGYVDEGITGYVVP